MLSPTVNAAHTQTTGIGWLAEGEREKEASSLSLKPKRRLATVRPERKEKKSCLGADDDEGREREHTLKREREGDTKKRRERENAAAADTHLIMSPLLLSLVQFLPPHLYKRHKSDIRLPHAQRERDRETEICAQTNTTQEQARSVSKAQMYKVWYS